MDRKSEWDEERTVERRMGREKNRRKWAEEIIGKERMEQGEGNWER